MPWFEIEPEDRLDDPRVIELSAEAHCLHDLLCARALRHGALADNPRLYRAMWGGKFRDFDAAYAEAVTAFDRNDAGLLTLPWIADAVERTLGRLKSDAERHRLARRQHAENGVHPDVHHDSGKTSARNPVTDRPEDRPTGKKKREAAPPDAPPSVAVDAVVEKKPRAEPTGPDAEFRRWWLAEFESKTGRPYAWNFGKDSALLSKMLKAVGLEETRSRAMRLLHAPPEWLVEGGVDIGTLSSQFNKLAAMGHLTGTNSVREAVIQAQDPRAINKPLFLPTPKQGR